MNMTIRKEIKGKAVDTSPLALSNNMDAFVKRFEDNTWNRKNLLGQKVFQRLMKRHLNKELDPDNLHSFKVRLEDNQFNNTLQVLGETANRKIKNRSKAHVKEAIRARFGGFKSLEKMKRKIGGFSASPLKERKQQINQKKANPIIEDFKLHDLQHVLPKISRSCEDEKKKKGRRERILSDDNLNMHKIFAIGIQTLPKRININNCF